jgi:hypothetical protein
MLVCSGGRYFNVGPPSSSPFPLAAWTTGGLRERFESVRAQETEDRRGRTTAIASQAHDRHDFDWCGSGGLFDDEDAYKAWHIKRSVVNLIDDIFFSLLLYFIYISYILTVQLA